MRESSTQSDIEEFRLHFGQIYCDGIRRLLNEEGMFLAFLAILTAVEALAGLFAPQLETGERFRRFVIRFFPHAHGAIADQLWKSRNLMVHAFNPGPIGLVCGQPHVHLTSRLGILTINVDDFFSAFDTAAKGYFEALANDGELRRLFVRRLADEDGGGIQSFTVIEPMSGHGAA